MTPLTAIEMVEKFQSAVENNPGLQEAVQCFKHPDSVAGDVD